MIAFGNGPALRDIDAVQRWAFGNLLNHGFHASPRGQATLEMLGQSFTLTDPRARMSRSAARHWSPALAVGEYCWHVAASDDVESLAYYAPRWREFATGGQTVTGSCYGRRIFGGHDGRASLWDRLITLLRRDPATRRAVIDLSSNDALDPFGTDVSCTSTFQALIRDGRLHAAVHMRSNDAVWGIPYDVFLFTMIQEMLAVTLGVDLGVYMHGTGSLHLYDRHVPLARRVLAERPLPSRSMPVMPELSGLSEFLKAEQLIRGGCPAPALHPYWDDLAAILTEFADTKSRKRTMETPA